MVCSILVDKSSIWIKYSVKVPAEFVEPVVRMFSKFLTTNVYVEQLGDPEDGIEKWAEINRKYSEIWPNISEKKEPPADAEEWQNIEDKFNKHFSEKPGR